MQCVGMRPSPGRGRRQAGSSPELRGTCPQPSASRTEDGHLSCGVASLQSGLWPRGLAGTQTQARRLGGPSVALQEPAECVGWAVGHLKPATWARNPSWAPGSPGRGVPGSAPSHVIKQGQAPLSGPRAPGPPAQGPLRQRGGSRQQTPGRRASAVGRGLASPQRGLRPRSGHPPRVWPRHCPGRLGRGAQFSDQSWQRGQFSVLSGSKVTWL